METGDIPPDIRQAVDAIFDAIQADESLADAMARALAAERERCAEIAENFPGAVLHFSDRPYDKPSEYRAATSADIAAAIRS